jgi:hypothetical protein
MRDVFEGASAGTPTLTHDMDRRDSYNRFGNNIAQVFVRKDALADKLEIDGLGRRMAANRVCRPEWSAPIEWSSLNVGAWSAFGLSGRCFWALVDGNPERSAV